MKPQVPPGPVPPLPWPVVLLTGLVVSLPRLPLLLRLPISVCELDCDIPSKNGLRQRSTARVSGRRGPERQPVDSRVELVFRKDLGFGGVGEEGHRRGWTRAWPEGLQQRPLRASVTWRLEPRPSPPPWEAHLG